MRDGAKGPPRPEEGLADWKLFEEKVKDGETVGFKDPEGEYHQLKEEEGLVQVKSDPKEDKRAAYIREGGKGGEYIPFDKWKAQKKGEDPSEVDYDPTEFEERMIEKSKEHFSEKKEE